MDQGKRPEFKRRWEQVALDHGSIELDTVGPMHRALGVVCLTIKGGPAHVYTYLSPSALDELISAAILVRASIRDEADSCPTA